MQTTNRQFKDPEPESRAKPSSTQRPAAQLPRHRGQPGGGSMSATSVRLLIRGLEIDAKCGEGCVVNLSVRAHKQNKGVVWRFCQHIANAFFSAGDFCNPGNHHRALRVIRGHVSHTPVNDGLTDRTDTNAVEIYPIHDTNGDAHYMALLAHEGVKRHYDGRPASSDFLKRFVTVYGRQEGTDDAHVLSPKGIAGATVAHSEGGAA